MLSGTWRASGRGGQLDRAGRLVSVVARVRRAQDPRRVGAAVVGREVPREPAVRVLAGVDVDGVVEQPVGVLAAAGGDEDRRRGLERLQPGDRLGGVGVDPERARRAMPSRPPLRRARGAAPT